MVPGIPNPRYEKKFVVSDLSLHDVTAALKRHRAGFREAYPPRTVNNVYFDSPQLKNFYDHLNGVPNRSKTRVRWYGPPDHEIQKPYLEQKLKSGAVGGKVTDPLPSFSINGESLREEFRSVFSKAELNERRLEHTRQLEPALFNRYIRHYYVSGDSRFRVTLDFDLQLGVPHSKNLLALLPKLSIVVIEFKFATAQLLDAEHIMNCWPFRLTRCSKYILGMERLLSA